MGTHSEEWRLLAVVVLIVCAACFFTAWYVKNGWLMILCVIVALVFVKLAMYKGPGPKGPRPSAY